LVRFCNEAKKVIPAPQERKEQRRSFPYGNMKTENPRITRGMIDWAAEALGLPMSHGVSALGFILLRRLHD
jgi:hypothetical protein